MPLKTRNQSDFLSFLQLMSPYPSSGSIVEYVNEYSTLPQCSSNIHNCQVTMKNFQDDKFQPRTEIAIKYYPKTLIRKKEVLKKINARPCNIFKLKNSEKIPQPQQFLLRSGYKDEFAYLKTSSEFYFDGFGIGDSDDLVTLCIFRLKRQEDNTKNLIEFPTEGTFSGPSKIFKDTEEEVKEEENPETDPNIKIYILELKGYCHLTDLEEYSEKFCEFAEKFTPYVQFKPSTL
ncbi:unnamed protein product [Moneuplotes crassus]|uniref:Uncharacterized protein n=1 Tax=Euplotes crassus TaxID=5936 RepID=A0AAD1XVB4_EUPCR|nr:unnamed protein product [Moneuplotes crassus]